MKVAFDASIPLPDVIRDHFKISARDVRTLPTISPIALLAAVSGNVESGSKYKDRESNGPPLVCDLRSMGFVVVVGSGFVFYGAVSLYAAVTLAIRRMQYSS